MEERGELTGERKRRRRKNTQRKVRAMEAYWLTGVRRALEKAIELKGRVPRRWTIKLTTGERAFLIKAIKQILHDVPTAMAFAPLRRGRPGLTEESFDIQDRVQVLVAEGDSKQEAFRKIAAEKKLTPHAVEGRFYRHERRFRQI